MSTFKIARIEGPREIALLDMDMPVLNKDEVKVKLTACAICTSDQGIYKGERGDRFPHFPGHEVVGIVEELGEFADTELKVGDKVVVCRMHRCGQCEPCRRGDDNRCVNSQKLYRPGRPAGQGGFAEYLVVPTYQVFKMNSDADMINSALIEPVACCVGSVKKADVKFGDTVLVIGAGIMGLLHAELLKLMGARVLVSEFDEKRREIAKEFADVVLDPSIDMEKQIKDLTDGYGVNSVFVTAGNPFLVFFLFKYIGGGADIVIYTSYYQPEGPFANIDLNDLHYKEYRLVGTISPTTIDFKQAIDLVGNGQIELSKYIRTTVPLEEVSKAFELAIEPGSYRVVVTMDK